MNSGFITMFIIMFIFSLFYVLIGYLMMNHHSKFPDLYAGYHVGHIAMKNHDTWETANKYSGKVMLVTSTITLVSDIIVLIIYFFLINKSNFTQWDIFFQVYLFSIVLIPISLTIILTEVKLRKTFDKYGFRKGSLDVFSGKDS